MICFKNCKKQIEYLNNIINDEKKITRSLMEKMREDNNTFIEATCKWKDEKESLDKKIAELLAQNSCTQREESTFPLDMDKPRSTRSVFDEDDSITSALPRSSDQKKKGRPFKYGNSNR